jgi:hypothetical protein
MKKCRNLKEIDNRRRSNPVAKHAHRFNKTQVFDDKSRYRRKAKHPTQEAFPKIFARIFGNVSCLNLSDIAFTALI